MQYKRQTQYQTAYHITTVSRFSDVQRRTIERTHKALLCLSILSCLFSCLALLPSTAFGQTEPMAMRHRSAVWITEKGAFLPKNCFHGYQTVQYFLKNTDQKKNHRVTLHYEQIQKTFNVPAGQTITATFSLPPIIDGYDRVRFSFDDTKESQYINQELKPIDPLSRHFYPPVSLSGAGNETVDFQDGLAQLLISRNLRKGLSESLCTVAPLDIELWPTDRLAYSPFDCIALTESELVHAPRAVQHALRDWVATGGNLWLFKTRLDSAAIKEISWLKRAMDSSRKRTFCEYVFHVGYWGFGKIALSEFDFENETIMRYQSDIAVITTLENNLIGIKSSTNDIWFADQTAENVHSDFPIIESLAIPYRPIFFITLAFAILSGPVCYYILARKNLRILLLVCVPAFSFITAGGIVLFIVFHEGFQTDWRYSTTTLIDQHEGTAATIGVFGYYARTTPRVITIDAGTELFPIISRSTGWRSRQVHTPRYVTWTAYQELLSGWIQPRTPVYFKFRKAEPTRLKLTFQFPEIPEEELGSTTKTATVVNGLSVPLSSLRVRDSQGRIWTGADIPAGAKGTLFRENGLLPEIQTEPENKYQFFLQGNWYNPQNSELAPGTYRAVLDTDTEAGKEMPHPFLEKGISYAHPKNSSAVVIGVYEHLPKQESGF